MGILRMSKKDEATYVFVGVWVLLARRLAGATARRQWLSRPVLLIGRGHRWTAMGGTSVQCVNQGSLESRSPGCHFSFLASFSFKCLHIDIGSELLQCRSYVCLPAVC